MRIRSIKQLKNLKNKRVLVRVDFNIKIKDGKVKETYKIEKSLPTIKYLSEKGAKVILSSHLGRPDGIDKSLSLKPVAKELAKLLNKNIKFVECHCEPAKGAKQSHCNSGKAGDCFASLAMTIKKMKAGEVALLENIRFFPGEEANDKKLAKELAGLADIFVLDGFAVAHRVAASVSGVAKFLPAYAGLLLEQEINGLSRVLEKPKRPLVAIVAGVKMETKIPVIKKLLSVADYVLIGGGIFSTYLWAKGYEVGISSIDKDFKKEALAYGKNKKIVMPVDFVVGAKDGKNARAVALNCHCEPAQGGRGNLINSGYCFASLAMTEGIYDIGPETIKLFAKYIKKSNTLVWNGALGFFEQHPYEYGTYSIARLIASRAKGKAFGVCGGGETVEVLKKLKLIEDIDLVSTGGGAMLEFLSGKKLPGVIAVNK